MGNIKTGIFFYLLYIIYGSINLYALTIEEKLIKDARAISRLYSTLSGDNSYEAREFMKRLRHIDSLHKAITKPFTYQTEQQMFHYKRMLDDLSRQVFTYKGSINNIPREINLLKDLIKLNERKVYDSGNTRAIQIFKKASELLKKIEKDKNNLNSKGINDFINLAKHLVKESISLLDRDVLTSNNYEQEFKNLKNTLDALKPNISTNTDKITKHLFDTSHKLLREAQKALKENKIIEVKQKLALAQKFIFRLKNNNPLNKSLMEKAKSELESLDNMTKNHTDLLKTGGNKYFKKNLKIYESYKNLAYDMFDKKNYKKTIEYVQKSKKLFFMLITEISQINEFEKLKSELNRKIEFIKKEILKNKDNKQINSIKNYIRKAEYSCNNKRYEECRSYLQIAETLLFKKTNN